MSTFVLPERHLSLKLIFENVANYAICGALFAFALWIKKSPALASEMPWMHQYPTLRYAIFVATFLGVLGLACLNSYQSYLLLRLWSDQVAQQLTESLNPGWLPARRVTRVLRRVSLAVVTLAVVAFLLLLLLLLGQLLMLAFTYGLNPRDAA